MDQLKIIVGQWQEEKFRIFCKKNLLYRATKSPVFILHEGNLQYFEEVRRVRGGGSRWGCWAPGWRHSSPVIILHNTYRYLTLERYEDYKEEGADEASGPHCCHSSSVIILHTGNLLWSGTKSMRRREPTRLMGARWCYSSPVTMLHW